MIPHHSPANESPVSTLRVSQRERDKIMRMLDAEQALDKHVAKRRSDRVPMPETVGVTVTIVQPGGSQSGFLVRAHNISEHGMGFIHGGFVHQGSKIVVTLVTPEGEQISTSGIVKRCEYVTNGVHFVGVNFDAKFDVAGFMEGLDKDAAGTQTATKAKSAVRVEGRVLLVDDSAPSRRLTAYMLSQIGATVIEADTVKEAVELMKDSRFDLVVADVWIGDVYLAEVVELLRSEVHGQPPVLAITGDTRHETHEAVLAAGCVQVLTKPTPPAALNQAIAERLPEPSPDTGDTRRVLSEYWSDLAMRPLILRFVRELHVIMDELDRDLSQAQDEAGRALAYRVCMRIGADAAAYGFPSIASVGQTMCMLIDGGAEAAELQSQMKDLKKQVDMACRGV